MRTNDIFTTTYSPGSDPLRSRSEPTNATGMVDADYRYGYDFDDIGNRETSSERGTNSVYTANNLNQYTAVDDFTPQFDDDGNQTLIKTATGIWSVTYNGENRPVLWRQGDVSLAMSYDRIGRRIRLVKLEGQSISQRQLFSYNGYLQIQRRMQEPGMSAATQMDQFVWDPTEPIASRPLAWNRNNATSYYTHDGNKNVSEVVAANGVITAHYEYAPFGVVLGMHGESASLNPWRFSCEYADDDFATVYYNYRYYEPSLGRWGCRDVLEEVYSLNLYLYCNNGPSLSFDLLGNSWLDFSPGEPPAEVGLGEGLIPIYGSLREFDRATYNGEWGKASFHALMAISDVFLVRSLIGAVGKGCWKKGAHTWSATRKWYAKHYGVEKGAEIHHMYIPQEFIRKHSWVAPIANQPWNLKVIRQTSDMSARKFHLAIHGCRVSLSDSKIYVELSAFEQYWYRYYSTGMMTGMLYFADDVRLGVSIIKHEDNSGFESGDFNSAVDAYVDMLQLIGGEISSESLEW